MEEEKNEEGFRKTQENKAKEKVKEQGKKFIKKEVIMPIIMAHLPIIVSIGIVFTFIQLIIIAGFLNEIYNNKVDSSSKAKTEAISYGLGSSVEGEESQDKKTINISYGNNGVYTISTKYDNNKKELQDVKDKIAMTGRDISDFSDFEIAIIGALMECGLDTQKYTTEQLKCLPLFIKAEGCTSYLDLRPNSEKFDSQGKYKPKKLEDLKENEIPGVILVQRTNTAKEEPTTLQYIDLDSFNAMYSQNNLGILNYFTIDKYNNLLIAKREYIKVEVEGEYPADVEKTEALEEDKIGIIEIPYSEYVKSCTMPFDFLVQLLISTNVPDFCKELTKIVVDSEIIMNIQEEERKTITEDIQIYTVWTKKEETIKYNSDLSEEDEIDYDEEESNETNTRETSVTKTVKVKTTEIEHTYSWGVTKADTWLFRYEKIYKKPEIPVTPEVIGPITQEYPGEYGEPEVTITIPEEDIETDEFEDDIDNELNEETEDDIAEIETKTYTKIDIKRTIKKTKEEYLSDPNPDVFKHIYAKDKDGNLEKFLLIYDKFNMKSLGYWLYNLMESNGNTTDLVDYIKDLLNIYDGLSDKLPDIDVSIFEPSKFSYVTNSKRMVIKTDEMSAIEELTREQIEEIITKNFVGEKQKKLLNAIEGLMYIQDIYHVNAVFAIAVTKTQSNGEIVWDFIETEKFDEAIRDFGKLMASTNYFQAGKYTPYEIGQTYSDENWAEDVTTYIKDMYESIGISIYTVGGNELQQKIVEVASNSSDYGIQPMGQWCQAWVKDVYYKAGANQNEMSRCCAVHAGTEWGVSTNFNQIQVGATVYGYSNSKYGHVGIYIGNGDVAHNIGKLNEPGVIKIDSLDDWIEEYDGICWGWNGGTDLTGGLYPCQAGLMTPNHSPS